MPRTILAMLIILLVGPGAHGQQPETPYAGYQQRPIKALSERQSPTCARPAAWASPSRPS
jgi:hypothetical protein